MSPTLVPFCTFVFYDRFFRTPRSQPLRHALGRTPPLITVASKFRSNFLNLPLHYEHTAFNSFNSLRDGVKGFSPMGRVFLKQRFAIASRNQGTSTLPRQRGMCEMGTDTLIHSEQPSQRLPSHSLHYRTETCL